MINMEITRLGGAVFECIALVWHQRERWWALGRIPALLSYLLFLTSEWVADEAASSILVAATLHPFAAFSVSWHRGVVTDWQDPQAWLPHWGAQHLAYVGRLVIVVVISLAAHLVSQVVAAVFADWCDLAETGARVMRWALLAALLILLLPAPLLQLPATAIGRRLRFGSALRATRGYRLGAVVLGVAVPWLVQLAFDLGYQAVGGLISDRVARGVADAAYATFTQFGVSVLGLTGLSLLYRRVVDRTDDEASRVRSGH